MLVREGALPGVGHVPAARRELVAPGIFGTVEPAARRELPFRFARQRLAGPIGVSLGIAIGDMHHRMIVEPADRALRSVRVPPVGAEGVAPPIGDVAQIDRLARLREHQRARAEHLWQRPRIILRVGCLLGKCHMAGLCHESAELPIGYWRAVHPEAIDADLVNRRLLGIMAVGPHAGHAARDPCDGCGARRVAVALRAEAGRALRDGGLHTRTGRKFLVGVKNRPDYSTRTPMAVGIGGAWHCDRSEGWRRGWDVFSTSRPGSANAPSGAGAPAAFIGSIFMPRASIASSTRPARTMSGCCPSRSAPLPSARIKAPCWSRSNPASAASTSIAAR